MKIKGGRILGFAKEFGGIDLIVALFPFLAHVV
jgi:hypothetical protein